MVVISEWENKIWGGGGNIGSTRIFFFYFIWCYNRVSKYVKMDRGT